MINSNDFGALNWVKGELDETIHKARTALESHVESEDSTDSLDVCADHLHQIAGVLQMAQVYGPGILAEEMESVVRAMAAGSVRQKEDAAEALMLALIQLPDYLEQLQGGDVDVPLIILPLLNDLRAVREAPLLSEAALFKPEIDRAPVADKIIGQPNAELPSLVRRLRQKYHLGLLNWFRKQDAETGWQYLLDVFDELGQHAGTNQVHRLAWVSGALVCGLIDHSISSGIAVKQLFGKIDRQLKRIIDEGEDALNDAQADDLLRNLLYYVAQAKSESSQIKQVKEKYELDAILPSETELAQGRQGLSGSNAELAASISDAIQTELTRIKDVLDLFMRKEQAETDMLSHLEKPMRQLADTLGMIGQGALRSRLLRQADKVQTFIKRSDPPEEYELMEMAGDILFVESSLGTLSNIQSTNEKETGGHERWGLNLPEGEYRNLIKQTVREAKVDIAKAKEAIIGYTEAPDEARVLNDVYQGFVRVCGALKLLEYLDAAKILEQTSDFIKTNMIDEKRVPARQQLNLLADVISSIEYFFEALVDGAGNRLEIIAIAQTALDGLLSSQVESEALPPKAEATPLSQSLDINTEETKTQIIEEELPGNAIDPIAEATAVEKAEMADDVPVPSAEKPALEDIDPEILEIFIEEAREELETIQQDLPAWQKNHDNKDAMISFRRSFHTLKGSGRLVGAKVIGELAWSIENMLNRVIDETVKPTPAMMQLLDDVLVMLPILIDCQEHATVPEVDVDAVVRKAFALADGHSLIEEELETEVKEDIEGVAIEFQPTPLDEVAENLDIIHEEVFPDTDDKNKLNSADMDQSEPVVELDNIPPTDDGDSHLQEFSDSDFSIEVDTELLDVFAEESKNHLIVIENFISQAKSSEPRLQITDEMIRACHTLHGSARMTGITPIANLSKSVENYLKTLNEKNYLVDNEVISLLEDSVSNIHGFLAWLSDDELPEPNADSYLTRLSVAQDELLGVTPIEMDSREDEGLGLPAIGHVDSSPKDSDIGVSALHGKAEEELAEQLTGELFEFDEDPELVEIFEEEAGELLEGIKQYYQEWLTQQSDVLPLEAIQRGLHTLKGSARLAGIAPVGDFSHSLEKVFTALVETQVQASEPLLDAIDKSLKTISMQLHEVKSLNQVHWAVDQIAHLETMFEDAKNQPEITVSKGIDEAISSIEDESPILSQVDKNEETQEAFESEDSSLEAAAETATSGYEEPFSFVHDEDLFEAGDDPELLEIFVEEAKELLESLDSSYHVWVNDTGDTQQLSQIQRNLHTLKGSARLAGVLPVGDLSHAIESVFIEFVNGHLDPSEKALSSIRQSIDRLASQVDEVESLGKVHKASNLIELLESIRLEIPEETKTQQQVNDSEILEMMAEAISEENDSQLLNEAASFLQEDDLLAVGEDPELVEVFIEEAKEILEHLESAFQRWTDNKDDLSSIEDIQRSLHTLKGSARLAGIMPVGDLSHAFESLLTNLSNGEEQVSKPMLNICRQALDKLATQIDEISTLGKVSVAKGIVEQLAKALQYEPEDDQEQSVAREIDEAEISELDRVQDQDQPESAVVLPFVSDIAKKTEPRKQQSTKPFKPNKDQVRINAELMDRLVNNAGEVSIYRARLEQQNNVLGFNLAELEQTVSRLFTQLRNLEMETEAQILYRWDRDNERDDREKAEFDPLELDRFSTMQQLSRALVETVSDLGSIYEALADLQRETDTLLLQQSRISTDLQDGLLRTRMVPFSQLIPRMQRLVRQTAEQVGKKAHLESFGSEGELDRNILNRMVPVLEHLLRNAVSHGIEFPDNRRAAGKQEVGQISLYVDREATDVLITLTDDGGGLNIEAIRAQAIRQGTIDENAEVSDDDLIQCVLNPGFSTAKEVTQIAGRGVGLDVVASEVKQLGGSLDIDSKAGQGTSFIIRLPLTLAITDALLVRVGEEVYAIPHGSVEGVVRIKHKDLQACYTDEQHSFKYADRNYKAVYLGRMMGVEIPELSENVRWFPLLLVHAGEHRVALQVDELLGTRQIVVKSVGKQVGSVRWITGGTILADGRVSLILDLGALVRMDAARLSSSTSAPEMIVPKVVEERIRVMVVDDSITVRKVTGRLLERHDMDVVTAKDGVEAVALLQEQLPDIMLLDIEMPRMDGFDVARHINNSVDYYGLPIIMISSRVGEKHRQRAFQLGVKRCLGKPYQETELLENINEVLAEVKA